MVLRDGAGRRLYVPFDCTGGRCPQYAADVASPRWRAHVNRRVRRAMRHRYAGVFLDDVNWQVNVSDGLGRPCRPWTRRAGSGRWRGWCAG